MCMWYVCDMHVWEGYTSHIGVRIQPSATDWFLLSFQHYLRQTSGNTTGYTSLLPLISPKGYVALWKLCHSFRFYMGSEDPNLSHHAWTKVPLPTSLTSKSWIVTRLCLFNFVFSIAIILSFVVCSLFNIHLLTTKIISLSHGDTFAKRKIKYHLFWNFFSYSSCLYFFFSVWVSYFMIYKTIKIVLLRQKWPLLRAPTRAF